MSNPTDADGDPSRLSAINSGADLSSPAQPPPPQRPSPGYPAPDAASTPGIRILTLNVWGLKHLSAHRTTRLGHIAHLISHPPSPHQPADIVCLQECWTYADYALIRQRTRSVLPYGKFYHSGCFGGGLVILSRWRMVEVGMVGYGLNGRPSAFWRGDWFVGKGVAWARVELSGRFSSLAAEGGGGARGRYLDVLNTHLHAPYDEGTAGKDSYACHRAAQAWQMAGLMRQALERGDLVVACGDFNMSPGGLEYRVIQHRTRGAMRDLWRELYPESSVGAWIEEGEKDRLEALAQRDRGPPRVKESLEVHGHTCDSILNTWRWSKGAQKDLLSKGRDRAVGSDEEDPRAKRLDYIFLGDGREGSKGNGEWVVKSARVCMTERHPELKCSLSDHFAVEAEIVGTVTPTPTPALGGKGENGEIVPHPNYNHHLHQKQHTTTTTNPPSDLYTALLSLISLYTTRQRLHRRRRCTHFLASVLITLSSFVAIWFSPTNYVSFLLLVLSSLGLMAGTVDGLIGLLFGGSELRGLKEWEWEVRNCWRREKEDEEEEEEKGGVGVGRLDGEGTGADVAGDWEEEMEMGRVRDWWD